MSNAVECSILRGDVHVGPPLKYDGTGYAEGSNYGRLWGNLLPGFVPAMQPTGLPGLPPSTFVGNAQITYEPSFREIPQPVRYAMSGAESCITRILEDVTITLTLYSRLDQNELWEIGAENAVTTTAQSVVNETVYPMPGTTIPNGTLIPFAKAPFNTNQPVTVSTWNTSTNAFVDLVQGVDYTFSMFGVKMKRDIALPANTVLVADYTSLPTRVADGFTDQGCPIETSLVVESKDLLSCGTVSGQAYKGTQGLFVPRCRLTPSGPRTLFGEEFSSITLQGNALPVLNNGQEVRLRTYKI